MSDQSRPSSTGTPLETHQSLELEKLLAEANRLKAAWPAHLILRYLCGGALLTMGAPDQAAEIYKSILVAKPDALEALLKLGITHRHLKQHDQAAECFLRVLAICPENFEALAQIAIVRRKQGLLEESATYLRAAAAVEPKNLEVLVALGTIFERLNRPRDAADSFEQVLRARPDHTLALNRIFELLTSLGDLKEAGKYGAKLISQNWINVSVQDKVKILGQFNQLNSASVRVTRGGRSLKISTPKEFAQTDANVLLAALPGAHISGGTTVVDLTNGTQSVTDSFTGLDGYLLRIRGAEWIPSNMLIAGDTLIDAGNGPGVLEKIGHNGGISSIGITEHAGKFEFQLPNEPPITKEVERAGLLVADGNYSSWILGELPRLHLYRQLGFDIDLLLYGTVKSFHRESLDLFGEKTRRVVYIDGESTISAKELYFATPTFHHHTMCFEALEFLRTTYLARTAQASKPHRSIYVSRSKLGISHDRRICNEDEVENFLAREGYEILHPQDMPVEEQIAAFASARRIVAPFGAALASLLFADVSARVCIIQTKATPEFDRLLQWLRIAQFTVSPRSHALEASQTASGREFTVNLDDLAKFLA